MATVKDVKDGVETFVGIAKGLRDMEPSGLVKMALTAVSGVIEKDPQVKKWKRTQRNKIRKLLGL